MVIFERVNLCMKKIFNLRPILFIALSVCCGIATTYFFMREKTFWGVFFVLSYSLSLLLFLIFSRGKKFKVSALFACIFLVFYLLGGVNVYARLNTFEIANLNGNYYAVSGRVDDIKKTDSSTKLIISNAFIDGKLSGKIKYKIALYVYGENFIDIGDNVQFSAFLSDKNYIYENRFNAEDVERGIKYSASVSADEIAVKGNSITIFERVNLFIRDALSKGLDDDGFAVGYAMLTGNSSFVDNDLLSSYRTAGVAHVFAVSGLHIGFLAVLLTFIFKRIRINYYIKALVITLVLTFYSGVCGFTASSLRATVMTAVILFARASGKRYDGLSALSLSAIIILTISPVQLLCVGFQLSFVVVLGINLLSKPISKLFKFLPKKFADSLGVVLSAQLFSIPVSLVHFGKFSIIAVAANLVFVPLVSVIFTITLTAVTIGGLFNIAHITLFPINYVFRAINLGITIFDHKFFMLGGILTGLAILILYAVAVLLSGLMRANKIVKYLTTIILVAVCTINIIVVNVNDKNLIKLYISGSDKICATFIDTPKETALIVSHTEYVFSVNKIARIASQSDRTAIDKLVFMGGYSVDMQVFITKIRTAFFVRTVYYYGEKNTMMEEIVKHAFSDTEIYNLLDGEQIPANTFKLKFGLSGKVVAGSVGRQKIAIFSSFKSDEPEFNKFNGNYDIMICCDSADRLIPVYNPKRGICYRSSDLYEDAQTNGNLLIKIE